MLCVYMYVFCVAFTGVFRKFISVVVVGFYFYFLFFLGVGGGVCLLLLVKSCAFCFVSLHPIRYSFIKFIVILKVSDMIYL